MNPEESLDIISRMVSDTRRSVLQQACVPFLTWGSATIVAGILVYSLIKMTGDNRCFFCWYLIPVLGLPLTRLFMPHTKMIRTGMATSLQSIWLMLTVLLLSFSLTSFFIKFNVLFFILLLLSIGSYVTGAVISYRFLMLSSVAGFIVSALLLVISGINQIPVFVAAIAVMMIVPGLKMKQDLKRL